jgi:hypothetical protein
MNIIEILRPFESKEDSPFNKKHLKQQTNLFILNLKKTSKQMKTLFKNK